MPLLSYSLVIIYKITTIVKLQVPCGFLENQQGDRLPFLDPARRERAPEPHGLLCHLNHVQGASSTDCQRLVIDLFEGARDWATKCSSQIRALPAEHPDLHAALSPLLRHRHRLLLRHLHVRLPEVYGLPHAGEGEAGNPAML